LDRTGFALDDDIMPARDPTAIVRAVKRGRHSASKTRVNALMARREDERAWP
jgi:hypothetical protein